MLYHISTDTTKVIKLFYPRIPKSNKRMKEENDYIPRICLGKSINDCLSAIPDGGYHFQSSEESKILRIYEFNTEQIEENNLIPASSLYFSDWVQDAWVTGECWVVNQKLIPSKVYDIQLKNVQISDAPYISSKTFRDAVIEGSGPNEILDKLEELATETVARVINSEYDLIQISKGAV